MLMSAPMVRAILAGTKTQTRRVVKITHRTPGLASCLEPPAGLKTRPGLAAELCPYGKPGDRLYVRETWAYHLHAIAASNHEMAGPWVYAADGEQAIQRRLCDRWRPSIHMPRAASRILLEVTAVRVERLQDISIEDAKAEGAWPDSSVVGRCMAYFGIDALAVNPRLAFRMVWEQINGPGSWDANPWVWVVEFKRVTP